MRRPHLLPMTLIPIMPIMGLLALIARSASAENAFDVVPVPDNVGTISNPVPISNDEMELRQKLVELQKRELSFKEREAEMNKLLEEHRGKIVKRSGSTGTSQNTGITPPSDEDSDVADPFASAKPARARPTRKAPQRQTYSGSSSSRYAPLIFVANVEDEDDEQVISEKDIPAGTFIKAKVVAGGEFLDNELTPALVKLEYTAMLPNGKRYRLKGCHAIMKGRAKLSIERAYFQAHKLSCTREDGRTFETPINAFLTDKDNNHGVRGVYISRQGQVLTAALLAKLVKGLGEGLEIAQMSTMVAGSENPIAAKNFTGDLGLLLAGKSSAEAAEMVADFYLRRAENLLPAIGVGSGEDVWVVTVDGFNLPDGVAEMEGLYND